MPDVKYAYRIPPCSKYDIEGTESWLEDLAAQGLILEQDGFFWGVATFIRSEPRHIRYRLEATDTQGGMFSETYDPDQDAVQLNQLMGWEYRARRGQFHIYTAEDPTVPEMHTDPRIQALTLKALTKYQRNLICHNLIMAAVYMLLFWGDSLLSFTAYFGIGLMSLLALYCLAFVITDIVNLVKMSRLRRRLQIGERMYHRADYRQKQWVYYCTRALSIAVGIYLVFAIGGAVGRDVTEADAVPLNEWQGDFPFATVSDLFPEAQIEYAGSFVDSEVTYWSNHIAPENYEYSAYVSLTLPDGEEATGYLYLHYHECRYEWFAAALANEFRTRAKGDFLDRIFMGSQEITELDVDADLAVTYQDFYPYVILRKGNTVLRARFGFETEESYTPEQFAQQMLSIMPG